MVVKRRLLIRLEQRLHRLFTFWLSDSDGSFYVALTRRGDTGTSWHGIQSPHLQGVEWSEGGSSSKTKRISYHATGMIVFHELRTPHIYCEPIYCVTQPFCFAVHSIPGIAKLDDYGTRVGASDVVIEAPDNAEGRFNFGCTIAPWDWVPSVPMLISARYDQLFSFHVSLEPDPLNVPLKLRNYFLCFVPQTGLFDITQVDNDTALLNFHQKKEGTKGFIAHFNQGVYTLIFQVPMASKPIFSIRFEDPSITAEVLKLTRTRVQFRAVDANKRPLKREKRIASIQLEANP